MYQGTSWLSIVQRDVSPAKAFYFILQFVFIWTQDTLERLYFSRLASERLGIPPLGAGTSAWREGLRIQVNFKKTCLK